MILPILSFGHYGLREETREVEKDYPQLKEMISNMFETMYHANGVGLAAPQVNIPLRIFVVDGSPLDPIEDENMEGFKKVFINPTKLNETGEEWPYEEGCLSIPDIREDVWRPANIRLRYFDQDFNEHVEVFKGMQARVIQHEYDHLEGVLFTDYLSGLRKKMVKSRLNKISKGQINAEYPMRFPKK
ncbi:MAG: peptide deformylase [Bacteroidia bacterium]|nr:peptide deformylase [Bacteroidia bacterium]